MLLIIILGDIIVVYNSMSLREKGNSEFKNNNLHKAIEYYLQHVQQENKDNELAYTNMAMCYFKLKDYRRAIEACENALSENKQCVKAYYRLYLTYMEIPNEQYKVFINAFLCLKYLNDDNSSAKADALRVMREYKDKFMARNTSNDLKVQEGILQDLEALSLQSFGIGQKEGISRSVQEWQDYLVDERVDFVQRCESVREVAESKGYGEGINLAYFFLNLASKQQQKDYIKQLILKLKREQSQIHKQVYVKQQIQQGNISKEEMSDENEQNLFASDSEPIHKEQQPAKEEMHQQQSKEFEVKKQQVEVKPIIAESVVHQLLDEESIERKIKEFLVSTLKCRDIFAQLKANICKLLQSREQVTMKKLYLTKLHQRCKEVSLIKNSFPTRDQKDIYRLLALNSLQQLCQVYAPKGK